MPFFTIKEDDYTVEPDILIESIPIRKEREVQNELDYRNLMFDYTIKGNKKASITISEFMDPNQNISFEQYVREVYELFLEPLRGLNRDTQFNTVSLPLITSPNEEETRQGLKIITKMITDFAEEEDMTIYLRVPVNFIFDPLTEDLRDDLKKRLDQMQKDVIFSNARKVLDIAAKHESNENGTIEVHSKITSPRRKSRYRIGRRSEPPKRSESSRPNYRRTRNIQEEPSALYSMLDNSLAEKMKEQEESFSEMLLRKIDEKGITDAECYKKANIDRRLFSKIKNNKSYNPSKETVIAFAVALEMPAEEAKKFLMKAGYAFSDSKEFDVIVLYFIDHHVYNIYTINEALFLYHQKLLGS